jgi:hypothetical protein
MRSTVTPEAIDARVCDLMRAMGGGDQGPGWKAGPVDVVALLRVAAMVSKAIGVPFDQVAVVLRQHWDELPDSQELQRAFRPRPPP